MSEELQRDAQLSGDLNTLMNQAIDNKMKGLHTSCPGFIVAFNKDTQTATVQPAIKMVMKDGTQNNLPLCTDVPVKFARGGGFSITFPVKAEKEWTLRFGDRRARLKNGESREWYFFSQFEACSEIQKIVKDLNLKEYSKWYFSPEIIKNDKFNVTIPERKAPNGTLVTPNLNSANSSPSLKKHRA